jgi:hypothetical protein
MKRGEALAVIGLGSGPGAAGTAARGTLIPRPEREDATDRLPRPIEARLLTVDLDQIIKDTNLNVVDLVRIAKARAAEALFLERFLKTARELLPFAN